MTMKNLSVCWETVFFFHCVPDRNLTPNPSTAKACGEKRSHFVC